MPSRKANPRDATGAKRDRLQAEHAAEIEKRQGEMSVAAKSDTRTSDEVIDMTGRGLQQEDDAQRWRSSQPLGPAAATRQPGQAGAGSIDADGYMTVDEAVGSPTISSVTTATTGGTLAAATYGYKVTAIDDASGEESGPSGEGTVTTTGDTSTATVNWGAITGAERYRVYGRTAGGPWSLLGTVTETTYTDTGTAIAANAPVVPAARGVRSQTVKTNSTQVTGTGTEGPSAIPGGTIADGRVRATVDTRNAQHVGAAGGADVEAPRVWTAARGQEVVEVEGGVMTAEAPSREIRVNTTVEEMTYGAGNHYSFVEGQRYRVPAHIADHLEELGYVWH